jgi:transposase
MMGRKRRRFGSEEKARILRRHLLDKAPVSDLCEEFGIQPTVFYRWQKQLFEGAASVFERQAPNQGKGAEAKVKFLEAKIRKKDEVLAELMEDHVALKKSLGEI